MKKSILISDFTIKEIPSGGSEWVDNILIKTFPLEFEYSQNVKSFDQNKNYIISNISKISDHLLPQLLKCSYIIIEHDSKFCSSRHPWIYPNCVVPKEHRKNYDLYKNAKAVFVQTTDHLDVFKINDVKANFINLDGGIWDFNDLDIFRSLYKPNKNNKIMIYATNNWIKNTAGSVDFCLSNNLPFEAVSDMEDRLQFLDKMSKFSGLVFIPKARETLCRLVVEAKCLGLEVITTKNYGASKSDWFYFDREKLLNYLHSNTKKNLKLIQRYL